MNERSSREAGDSDRATGPVGQSPCLGLCRIDPGHGYCVGCFRSLDEICNWLSLAEDDRAEVVHRCDARRARLGDDENTG